jgi:hypothetical protein
MESTRGGKSQGSGDDRGLSIGWLYTLFNPQLLLPATEIVSRVGKAAQLL